MAKLDKGIILSTFQTALNLIKAYIDDRASTLSSAILDLDKAVDEKLPLTGGTLTGDLSGKYITGTWLQGTASNHLSSAATKYCVQDSSGWLYHRTAAELLSDTGVTKDWGIITIRASGWSSSTTNGWYTNKVTVSGMLAEYNPYANPEYTSGSTVDDEAAAFGAIKEIETFNGYIIARAKDKPSADIKIRLLGV